MEAEERNHKLENEIDKLKRELDQLRKKHSYSESSRIESDQSKKIMSVKARHEEEVLIQQLQNAKREHNDDIEKWKQEKADMENYKARLEKALLELHVCCIVPLHS
jgi:hypothetical protein